MDRDDHVEPLSEADCLRLLRTVPVGRVVYTEHALPAVLPVGFEVTADGRLVLGLQAGGATVRALDGTVAAFQADRLDPVSRSGWSVLVHGRAEVIRDRAEHQRLVDGGPCPWVGGDGEQLFVRITPELVTGRRLPATAPAPGS